MGQQCVGNTVDITCILSSVDLLVAAVAQDILAVVEHTALGTLAVVEHTALGTHAEVVVGHQVVEGGEARLENASASGCPAGGTLAGDAGGTLEKAASASGLEHLACKCRQSRTGPSIDLRSSPQAAEEHGLGC